MECPHCEYKTGWIGVKVGTIEGDSGEFFDLPVRMERSEMFCEDERKTVHGCPKCGKLFITI